MRTSCLFVACLFVAPLVSGQALITTPSADAVAPGAPPAPADVPSKPVFRAGVDLVALNVVVTDRDERFISGLTADDFAIYEDGVQQDVSFFASAVVPLDLALLLDTSASMTDKMNTMQKAALGFLQTLRPADRASIVDIKDRVEIAYPLGSDLEAAGQAVRTTVARGGTALFNGLYMTLKDMVKKRNATGEVRRQAIAVLSDGDDTASLVSFDDVMEVAKRAGITVYTVTLKSPHAVRQSSVSGRRYFSQADFAMRALAQETGARAFFPTDIQELAGIYGSIAQELAHQYAIGYASKNPRHDGAFRRVIVRVEERPGARIRTRSGYLSARNGQTLSTP